MPSYFAQTSDADAIAATVPGLQFYAAANDAAKALAIELASEHVDSAYRYQGRRYNEPGQPGYEPNGSTAPPQLTEFPRVAFENSRQGIHNRVGAYDINATWVEDQIWDWDSVNNVAVVPHHVLRAVVYEADSILGARRNGRLDAQHDGVADQRIGSAAESYRDRRAPVLCREADNLMQKYRLKQGRLI